MVSRNLYTEIWTDSFFNSLIVSEKLLFIYLLTNDQVNIIHLYKCPDHRIRSDTGIDTPIIEKSKIKFEQAQKMYFKEEYVFLRNAEKFEKYTGLKNEISKEKLLGRLSKGILDWYSDINNTPIDTPINTPTMIPSNININTNINNIEKNSKNSLIPCTEEEIQEIANRLEVSVANVKSTHAIILNKIEAKEFKGRTVYHSLDNWVRMGIERGTIRKSTSSLPRGYTPYEKSK